MPGPACIAPKWSVIPGRTRSAAWRAAKDNFFAPSPIHWRKGQEHCVNTLARDAGKDYVAMLCPDNWGYCTQHGGEDSPKTVPEDTRKASWSRQPTKSSEENNDESNVPVFSATMQRKTVPTSIFSIGRDCDQVKMTS